MLDPAWLYGVLAENDVDFFCGVPDSLLKSICAYITDHVPSENHIIASNEGAAMAIAAGYHLATGRLPLVYLQNSGIGNLVNPLLSLADPDVYSIPMLIMIGWRGEPGVKDEPQHVKQGRVMLAMLEAMEVPYCVISGESDAAKEEIARMARTAVEQQRPTALIIRKSAIGPYQLQGRDAPAPPLAREQAIELIVESMAADDVVVSTTGMISRELYELRRRRGEEDGRDFLTVGSMGHACSIALGIALRQPARRVFCLDGDGAVLMHMGSLAIQGRFAPRNFRHIVLNNGCHDSVGGQPTVGFEVSLPAVAAACGYTVIETAETPEAIREGFGRLCAAAGPAFFEVRVRKGARKDLGRPLSTPLENKTVFMGRLRNAPGNRTEE